MVRLVWEAVEADVALVQRPRRASLPCSALLGVRHPLTQRKHRCSAVSPYMQQLQQPGQQEVAHRGQAGEGDGEGGEGEEEAKKTNGRA